MLEWVAYVLTLPGVCAVCVIQTDESRVEERKQYFSKIKYTRYEGMCVEEKKKKLLFEFCMKIIFSSFQTIVFECLCTYYLFC